MTLDAPRKKKSPAWHIAMLFLLGFSLVVAHRYGNELLKHVTDVSGARQVTPPPCNLNRERCDVFISTPAASEKPWLFSITPHPIPVSAPLSLTLSPPERIQQTPMAAWVDLTGDDMDMGLIRISMQQNVDGSWTGTGSIPVCVSGTMRWRARLHLQLAQTIIQADWVFTAPEPGARHAP